MIVGLSGRSNLLGSAVFDRLRSVNHDIKLFGLDSDSHNWNYQNPKSIHEHDLMIDGFIHCAAVSIPIDQQLGAVKELVEFCNLRGSHLVYISSHSVFSGQEDHFSESATPCPSSEVGCCKLSSEKWIASNSERYTILRPSIIYGLNSITKTVQFADTTGPDDDLLFDTSVETYPIWNVDFAEACATALERPGISVNRLFNISSKTPVSGLRIRELMKSATSKSEVIPPIEPDSLQCPTSIKLESNLPPLAPINEFSEVLQNQLKIGENDFVSSKSIE